MTNPFVSLTPAQRSLLQSVSDDVYKSFVQDIAQARHLATQEASIWADGKIFTGVQALKLGLVDELGSYSHAIKKIKELAPIEGNIEWILPAKRSKWAQLLMPEEDEDDEGDQDGGLFNVALSMVQMALERCALQVQ